MDGWTDGQIVCVVISLLPSAIYLCKRTMQNKARLELADYESVSIIIFQGRCGRRVQIYLQLCFSSCFSPLHSPILFRQWKGSLFYFPSFVLSSSYHHLYKDVIFVYKKKTQLINEQRKKMSKELYILPKRTEE